MRTLLLILLSATPAMANRAVMEELAASNNSIFIDTVNVRVGVGNAVPAATLDVTGNAQFGTTVKSTFTAAGALTLASGAALTLSGSAGNVVTGASVTASAFFGSGNGLTGTAASLTAGAVTTNANLTGDVTSSGNATTVVKINGTSMAGLATGILKNTTTTGVPSIAIAADFPTLNQNTSGNAATVTTNANLTGPVTSVGNATTIAGPLPAISGAALTSLTPSNLSNGGLPNGVKISTANVGAGFNGASELVQLDGSAKMPAVDGSQLTNISGTLTGGTNGFDARWTGSTTLAAGPFSESASSATLLSGSTLLFKSGANLIGSSNYATTTTGLSGTWTNTTFTSPCLSTVTITTSGNPVGVFFSGTLSDNGNGGNEFMNILQDGAFPLPYSSTLGTSAVDIANATAESTASFYVVLAAPSAGSHSYCLMTRSAGNTGSFGSHSQPVFGAMELH